MMQDFFPIIIISVTTLITLSSVRESALLGIKSDTFLFIMKYHNLNLTTVKIKILFSLKSNQEFCVNLSWKILHDFA